MVPPMRRAILSIVFSTLGVVVAAACNSVGDCPSSPITPGGSCSTENLQCAYTLPASDDAGTPTSCICTMGAWACPSASSGDDGGGDDSTGSDSSVDASVEAAEEAAAEAGMAEASFEASTPEGGNAGMDVLAESAVDAGGG
jgi:hypothetical protein